MTAEEIVDVEVIVDPEMGRGDDAPADVKSALEEEKA